jgi:hypothetical protein
MEQKQRLTVGRPVLLDLDLENGGFDHAGGLY